MDGSKTRSEGLYDTDNTMGSDPRRIKKKIAFPRVFEGDMQVLCWIKDFRFRTWCGDTPYSLAAHASNVTTRGFTAIAQGSMNAERLSTTWIIHRQGKPKVASGTFKSLDGDCSSSTGRIAFPKGTFNRTPTVLVALSAVDHAGGRDLRIGTYVTKINPEGFDWHLRESEFPGARTRLTLLRHLGRWK